MKPKRAVRKVIHERNALSQHRLIILRGDIPEASPWWEAHEVGRWKGMVAAGRGNVVMDEGVFRLVAVAHEGLA